MGIPHNAGFTELGLGRDYEFLVPGLGIPTDAYVTPVSFLSTAVDAGNTPNTSLRRGLQVSGTDVNSTDWTNGVAGATLGFLWSPLSTLDPLGTAVAKHQILVVWKGTIRGDALPENIATNQAAYEAAGFVFV